MCLLIIFININRYFMLGNSTNVNNPNVGKNTDKINNAASSNPQNPMQQQVQQQNIPYVESIKINAKLLKNFNEIYNILSNVAVFSTQLNPDNIIMFRVESRDLQKKPFLFTIFNFNKDSIELQYSIAFDASKKLRRLSITKEMLSILSLIDGSYELNTKELFQHLDSIIDDVLNSLSQNYSALFNNYDAILNEHNELKKINFDLTASNKNLTITGSQLEQQNKQLSEKLKDLELYSDESLMVMVQEWIEAHGNSIDINEFAKNYKLLPPRVEQILNKMVSLGYLELKS